MLLYCMYWRTFQRAAGERISVAGQQAGDIARKLGECMGLGENGYFAGKGAAPEQEISNGGRSRRDVLKSAASPARRVTELVVNSGENALF